MPTNRQFLIDHLPTSKLTPDVFRLSESTAPSPGEGEVLVRTRYVSLDAANRAWMWGATYRAALKAGDVMAGGALAEVVESRSPGFAAGDLVWGDAGWQDYAVLKGSDIGKLGKAPAGQPLTYLISVYGIAGLTAYFGLLEVGQPRAGETVVVSAAGGSVGSLVGQIAKIKGCRVVGIAGGADKCALLTSELGFDAAVDYKSPEFNKALRAAVPKGIDVYFDNVGGAVLEACLFNMNQNGRISCCGAVSQYDSPTAHGPRGVPGLIVTKRLTMRGFIVMDFDDQSDRALADLHGWVASGQLKVREDIVDGFEQLPAALIGLLAGDNIGKRMVKVA